MGLSGVGWSQYELNAFDQSAAAFGEVFEKFSPEILQVAEAGFMRGRALQKAGKLADAAHAYTQAFEKLAPAGAARPGEESHGPTQYGFFAGMQAANLLAQLKRYDDADAAYQRVAEHYPKADKLADVLFDWANVLYVAKKDASQKQRIRDLLSRIERDFPASAAQPKARLFLAELDAQGGQAASADKMLRGLVSDNAADAKNAGRRAGPARHAGLREATVEDRPRVVAKISRGIPQGARRAQSCGCRGPRPICV